MNPERMGTDPEGVDRAKRVIDILRAEGIEPDGVEFRARTPDHHSGKSFAVHFEGDNDAFVDDTKDESKTTAEHATDVVEPKRRGGN